jgi:ParB-like nuclease domain
MQMPVSKILAASIEAHGLLQNLQVKPTANGEFEVVAGGRRHAALKLLAIKVIAALTRIKFFRPPSTKGYGPSQRIRVLFKRTLPVFLYPNLSG